jgi:hypothetical protein
MCELELFANYSPGISVKGQSKIYKMRNEDIRRKLEIFPANQDMDYKIYGRRNMG